MIFNTAAILSFCAAVLANPSVNSPYNMTYSAGDVMTIKWNNADTGKVNIDLVDAFPDVMKYPISIAQGVEAQNGKFDWKIPSNLKSAAGYRVRVWGTEAPEKDSKNGQSNMFTVLNVAPDAIPTFTVTSPSKSNPCEAGKACTIAWDFPEYSNYPANVNIALYKAGNPVPVQYIGIADTIKKSYTWNVPNDSSLVGSDMYISVSGEGNPVVGPGSGNNMGANSKAFSIDPYTPSAQSNNEEKKSDEEAKDKKKIEKKKLPKASPPPSKPKVTGAATKSNAASSLTVGEVAKVAALVAFIPMAFLF